MKKGQLALEFLISVLILVLILQIFIAMQEKQNNRIEKVSNNLRDEIKENIRTSDLYLAYFNWKSLNSSFYPEVKGERKWFR